MLPIIELKVRSPPTLVQPPLLEKVTHHTKMGGIIATRRKLDFLLFSQLSISISEVEEGTVYRKPQC